MTRGKSQGGAREQSCSELRGGVGGILQVDKHADCVVYLYKYYKYPIVTFVYSILVQVGWASQDFLRCSL